jgi:hypothetical protein
MSDVCGLLSRAEAGAGVDRERHGTCYVVAQVPLCARSEPFSPTWAVGTGFRRSRGFRLINERTAKLPGHRAYAVTSEGKQKFWSAIRPLGAQARRRLLPKLDYLPLMRRG